MHNLPGQLIVFEGGEGSGKSSHLQALSSRLNEGKLYRPLGFTSVITTRHPGGTGIGGLIRQLLLHDTASIDEQLDPLAEALLFASDYSQHYARVIVPALEAGALVLCDRYTYSGISYQGYGSGINPEILQEVYEIAVRGLIPDLVVWMDVPPDVGLLRAKRLSQQDDRIESMSLDFHRRVRDGFEQQFSSIQCPVIKVSSLEPKAEVELRIFLQVTEFLKLRDDRLRAA